jgi:uncharacterized SAM-binding protein YcdF (DUF218 family)
MLRIKRSPPWLLIGLIAVAGVFLAGPPVLLGLADLLISDQPAGDFQYVGIVEWYHAPDGDRCNDAAAKLFRENPSRGIVLVQSPADRLLEIGVLPSFESLCRRELEARGVPRRAVAVTSSDGLDDWATARAIRAWLADRPQANMLVLCGAFSSAHLRHALDTVLDPADAYRVRTRALDDRRFDRTNWWTTRTGIKAFGIEWLRRLHGWCAGDHPPPPFHLADAYERDVQRSLLECTPQRPTLLAEDGASARAEYVMLLNGGENERPFAAVAVLKAGVARQLLVTEVAPSPTVDDRLLPPSHEINRQVLLKRGIPDSDITVLPAAAATTNDEAQALAAFLCSRPSARVVVVTNDYHVPRSRWVFARVLGERAGHVSFVSAPSDQFPVDYWWQDEAAFLAIATEPFKFAFYVASYGHAGGWLAACGGLALVAFWIWHRQPALRCTKDSPKCGQTLRESTARI